MDAKAVNEVLAAIWAITIAEYSEVPIECLDWVDMPKEEAFTWINDILSGRLTMCVGEYYNPGLR